MGFLFAEDNHHLQRLMNCWIQGNDFGAYMLLGESGSGKTTFLKQFEKEWQNVFKDVRITWMSSEELIDIILKQEDIFRNIETQVYIVENMEGLLGKHNTISYFWEKLECWVKEDRHLFIGTTNKEQIDIPSYVEVVSVLQIVITPSVVSYVADIENVQLDSGQIELLCNKAEGSVSRLRGLVKREKLLSATG